MILLQGAFVPYEQHPHFAALDPMDEQDDNEDMYAAPSDVAQDEGICPVFF